MIYIVFDIETTGLDTLNDRIVELGAIKVEDGVVVDEFDKLINPGITIPPIVTAINGITNEMVENEDYPGVVLSYFNKFIEGADFLIGHNAIRFDYPFLLSEFKRNYVKNSNYTIKDTVIMARLKLRRQLRSFSLQTLTKYYGIENRDAHRALSDVYATYEVYKKLIEE
ncbi:MAG: 3'-5' exonuclease [Candidatus Izimaplasma sp.]|nr:3'-5' exonuclease [Candidatus Izimaplasma bacterium]